MHRQSPGECQSTNPFLLFPGKWVRPGGALDSASGASRSPGALDRGAPGSSALVEGSLLPSLPLGLLGAVIVSVAACGSHGGRRQKFLGLSTQTGPLMWPRPSAGWVPHSSLDCFSSSSQVSQVLLAKFLKLSRGSSDVIYLFLRGTCDSPGCRVSCEIVYHPAPPRRAAHSPALHVPETPDYVSERRAGGSEGRRGEPSEG